TYINNYKTATHGSGRLMLFAGDQKVEHLNDDFFGEGIHIDNNNPEHLFKIACKAKIGVFATQLGLIARYGMDYPDIPYLIKLNSKSHLVKTNQRDPVSNIWYFKDYLRTFVEESKLNILAVGYTIYLGSEFESEMLSEAAQTIFTAHQMGLFTVLWIYPRGKAIPDEKNPHLIAGATGIGAALGSDFVKVNAPSGQGLLGNAINSLNPAEHLKEAVQSAGRTKVICAGGTNMDAATFLNTLYDQIYIAGVSGNATGRNIHQKPLAEAIRFANAIYAITIENKTVEEALQIYNG
ncbi:MAG TPA: hypothetical protein VK338_01045, partial [Candidatus Nitrosocosmicus sp.]|nr:hypothetical protein [Candidatus Nitrosocosmicus sp.]